MILCFSALIICVMTLTRLLSLWCRCKKCYQTSHQYRVKMGFTLLCKPC